MTLDLMGIFAAGLLTFLTPCVLPLMPIYLAALAGGDLGGLSASGRGRLMVRAGLFSVGFLLVFTLMGLTASTLGGFLADHKAAIQLATAVLILLFGLKFVGFIHIPLFDRVVRADDTRFDTRFGAFNALIMGVLFAAGWSPCVGPVLGSVLTYTASNAGDPLTGAVYLTIYGAGFALPLLLVALFAQAGVRFLRKINPFLPKIERAIGVLLLLVAAYLFEGLPLGGVAPEPEAVAAQTNDFTLHEDGKHWPVMLELYSESCSVCERMEPIVAGISGQCHGKQVRIVQVDVSAPENRHFAEKFRLVGVPTFLFLDEGGEEVARLVGEQTDSALRQALSALRGEPCPGVGDVPDIEDIGSEKPSAACGGEHFDPVEMFQDSHENCDI